MRSLSLLGGIGMRDFAKASVGAVWASGWGLPWSCKKVRQELPYHVEVSCELIAVVDSELAAVDADIEADAEVLGHERPVGSIAVQGHLSLQESALGSAAVCLLRLGDHDRVVLKEVEDHHEAQAVVLEARLDHALFKVSIKSQHL